MGKPKVAKLLKKRDVVGLISALDQLQGIDQSQVFEALAELRDPSAIPALAGFVSGPAAEDAMKALARIGSTDAAIALVEALGDERWKISTMAGDMLKGVGDPGLIDALGGVLEAHQGRGQDALSWRVVHTFEVLASTPIGAQRALDLMTRSDVATATEKDKLGNAFLRAVTSDPKHAVSLLLDPSVHVRERMAGMLSKHRPNVRAFDQAAIEAVPELEARGDGPSLSSLAHLSNAAVRLAAVEALGRLGDPRGVEAIFFQLHEGGAPHLSSARDALVSIARNWDESSIGRDTVDIVISVSLAGPVRRQQALELFVDIGDAAAAKVLKGLADGAFKRDVPGERQAVADALERLKRPRDLVQFCRMPEPVAGAARTRLAALGRDDLDLEAALTQDDIDDKLVATARIHSTRGSNAEDGLPDADWIGTLLTLATDPDPSAKSLANIYIDDVRRRHRPIGDLVIANAQGDRSRMLELARPRVHLYGSGTEDEGPAILRLLTRLRVWDEEIAGILRERIPEQQRRYDAPGAGESGTFKSEQEIIGPWLSAAKEYVANYAAATGT